jgi:membrane protease YdiL (CAAX protease family)
MSGLGNLVRRHPVAIFVVLAYLLSWTLVPWGGLLGAGPLLAAIIVLAVAEGRSGVIGLLRQMVQWRMHWGWYAVAILLPAGIAALAAVLTVSLGAPRPSTDEVSLWSEVPFAFLLFLLVPLFGPWEEPGFRGFALTRLMREHAVLVAALLVGVIHIGFHGPLFLTGDIPLSDAVMLLAVGVVLAWLVLGTRGSVLIAMIAHASNNAVSGEYISPMFSGGDADLLGWIRAGLWCVAATVVVLAAGPGLGVRREHEDIPRPARTRQPL